MTEPHIVLFDLETLPNLNEALKAWPNLSNFPGQTLRASITSIICAGWKILGSDEVHCINAWDFPEWNADVNDDKKLCEALAEVLGAADCVITHNGKKFDWKHLQTRLRYHKLPPLPPLKHVDTCAESKKHLFVLNNRLQTLARFLTDRQKMDHEGWDLWVKVHARNAEAMRTMTEYCKQDVVALEAVFRELRPLLESLPNFNLFSPIRQNVCPRCGSTRLKSKGRRYTKTKTYRRYLCIDCYGWCHTGADDNIPR